MKALYVAEIESNVKAGAKAQLGRHTLIVGPNGSGKTSLLNALALALNGRAFDVGGNATVSDGAAIARYLGHGGDPLFSRAQLSDGTTALWQREGTRTTHQPGNIDYYALSADVLTGSNEARREEIQRLAASFVDDTDLRRALDEQPDVHVAAYTAFVDANAAYALARPLDRLVAVADAASKAAKAAKVTAGLAQTAMSALAAQAGVPVDDAQVDAARAELARVSEGAAPGAVSQAARDNALAAVAAAEQQLDALRGDAAALDTTRAQWVSHRATLHQPEASAYPADLLGAIVKLADYSNSLYRNGHTSCFMCGTACDATAAVKYAANLKTWAEGEMSAGGPTPEMIEADRNIAQVDAAIKDTADKIAACNHRLAMYRQTATAPVSTVDPQAISAAAAQVSAFEARQRAYLQHNAQRDALRNAEKAQATAEIVEKVANALRVSLMRGAIGALETAISAYMPDGFRCAIREEKPHIMFGITDASGEFRSAASGAEEAMLLLAIAAFRQSTTARPQVIVAPERQWSPDRLAAVMRALEAAPCQVIIVSTAMPAGRLSRAIWTVIDTTKVQAAKVVIPDAPIMPPPVTANAGKAPADSRQMGIAGPQGQRAVTLTHEASAPPWLHGYFYEVASDAIADDATPNDVADGALSAGGRYAEFALFDTDVVMATDHAGRMKYFQRAA